MHRLPFAPLAALAVAFLSTALLPLAQAAEKEKPSPPPKVAPPASPGAPPADALVLFDGTDLSGWTRDDGGPIGWTIEDGALLCKPGSGSVVTKEKFGDVQLHVEFSTPSQPDKQGQDRGNSGVYLQARYEVQVLDSHGSDTYPDGQCGAIYGQHPPLVNVCRPPGEWQTYDIAFRAPVFAAEGLVVEPARITVFHNGVLIQDNVPVRGQTTAAMWKEGPGEGPIYLQDHGNTVKYRNIWLRKLPPRATK